MLRLALALGKTVREIEETMPATELAEWAQLYEEEPFGDVRADLHAAIVACTVARALGGNKQARIKDFLPSFTITAPVPPAPPRGKDAPALPAAARPPRGPSAANDAETARLMAVFDAATGLGSKRRVIKRTVH